MNIKQKAVSTKNFVKKHRVAIAVGITAATCLSLNARNLRVTNEFLKEKGLYEEFYATEEA